MDTNIDWGPAHAVEDEEDVVEGDGADEVKQEPGAHVTPSYQLRVQYHLLDVVHFHNSFQSLTSNIWLIITICTCSEIEPNIDEEDGVRDAVENHPSHWEVIVEEGDGNGEDDKVGHQE